MQALEELEHIDDECDKYGIQFVKIDDPHAAVEYGLDSLPTVVYFEKGIPNMYDGNLEEEDSFLEWLVEQLEKDEIEDVTDEMLDKLIDEGKTLAVLFCMSPRTKSVSQVMLLIIIIRFEFVAQTTRTIRSRSESSTNWKISTTNAISWVLCL